MAAPSYVAQGAAQAVTTSAAMPYPAGLAAGDLLLLTVSNTATGINNAPAGWTEIGTATTGGSMTSRRWYKISDGTETGSVTITVTSGVSGIGYMVAYRPANSGYVLTPTVTTGSDAVSDTSYSTTGSSWTSAVDNRVVAMVIALAATTFSAVASSRVLSQASATYSQTDRFAARAATNTLYYAHSDAAVTAGGTGAPSFTATLNGAGTGHTVFVLITETPGNTTTNAVAATATAAAVVPAVTGHGNGSVAAVRATATAAAGIPAIGNGSGAPTFVASSGAQGSSAVTSLTATIPGTVAAGNVGFIVSYAGGGSGASTAPAGWSTLVPDTSTSGGSSRFSIYYRTYVAGDADPVVTWASAPPSGNNTAILAFWYTAMGTPTAGTVSTSSTASTTWTAPSLTTPSANNTVVAIAGEKGGSGGWGSIATWSPDATMRATRYGTGNFYPSIVVGDLTKTTAGATNGQTATWNYSTAVAFAVQLDFPPVGVGASVSAVTGTATALMRPPGTGSHASNFPPAATSSSSTPVPAIIGGTALSGGGPTTASAIVLPPGVRQRVILNVRATATAALIAPPPLGSSNVATRTVAAAEFAPPFFVIGGARVTAVVATATALVKPPTVVKGSVLGVKATATAAVLTPRIGQSTVRPSAAVATALVNPPLVGGFILAVRATASATSLAPQVRGSGFILSALALANAFGITPIIGHVESVFRTPTYFMHYNPNHPLLKRVKYPTGIAILLIDGFYIAEEYPSDEQIAAATKVYLGGYDYILTSDEVASLTAAGYGEFITQEAFTSV